MTPPRGRGRVPRRGWAPALLTGAVLLGLLTGCSRTAPGSGTAAPSDPTATTTDATTEPATDAAPSTQTPPDAAGTTADPATTTAAAPPTDLDCGLTVLDDGRQVVRYCGEGTASVELPLRTLELEGAECDLRGSFATVNVGVSHQDPETASHDYLGVVLGGLEAGAETTADHVALELVVRGSTLPLHDQEATVDLTDDHELRATVEALTQDDGKVRMTVTCPLED